MKNYLSNLRVLGTFCVILLHVAAKYIPLYKIINLDIWNISNFLDSIVRFCVPVFLMISGAILLDKDEPIPVFLNKRFKRVLYPFMAWNLFYFFFYLEYSNLSLSNFGLDFAKVVFQGSSFHFWYIYMILGIYLFVPILRKWTLVCTKKECLYFLGIWMFTLLINNEKGQYFSSIELIYFSKYIGYLVLGFYLDKFVITKKSKLWLYFTIFAIGFSITFYLTYFFTKKENYPNQLFYEYLTPNVLLMAIGIFLLFKQRFNSTNKLLINLDKCSYGVYLIHIFVLEVIYYLCKFDILGNIYIFFICLIVQAIAAFICSSIIITFLSKIKSIKRFVT